MTNQAEIKEILKQAIVDTLHKMPENEAQQVMKEFTSEPIVIEVK